MLQAGDESAQPSRQCGNGRGTQDEEHIFPCHPNCAWTGFCLLSTKQKQTEAALRDIFVISSCNEQALFCRICRHFIRGFNINVITKVTSSKPLEYTLIEVYKTGSAKWFENSPHSCNQENLTLAVKKKGKFQNR